MKDRVYLRAFCISGVIHGALFIMLAWLALQSVKHKPVEREVSREVSFVYEEIVPEGIETQTHLAQKQVLTKTPSVMRVKTENTVKPPLNKLSEKVLLPEIKHPAVDPVPDNLPIKEAQILKDAAIANETQTAREQSAIGGSTGNMGVNLNPEGSVMMFGPIVNRSILYSEVPEYPDWARKRGIETEVKMRIWVNPYGDVTDTMIIRKSGYLRIDLLVEGALRRWKFTGLGPDVAQVKQWGDILIKFVLY